MFNQQLGSRLEALFPDAHILSASAIAAPAFLAAALRRSQRVVVADRAFDVRALAEDDDLEGVVPVAAFDAQAGTAELFPAAAPGVLALVPDDEPDDDGGHGGRSCGRGRGWRATTGRLARGIAADARGGSRATIRSQAARAAHVRGNRGRGRRRDLECRAPTTTCSTAPTSRSRPSPPPATATSRR